MRILILNDDGISSPGLRALVDELGKYPDKYSLTVVAPESEQSGVSHHISFHTPVRVREHPLPGVSAAVRSYTVGGTPADCVKVAITAIDRGARPDLVLSGINRGPNVGLSVYYSGTVAGAREALLNGIPAIALSLNYPPSGEEWSFGPAAEATVEIIKSVQHHALPPGVLLNVNFPHLPKGKLKGIRLTRQGSSGYDEAFVEDHPTIQDGYRWFHVEGRLRISDPDAGFDGFAMNAGWISVSPLGLHDQEGSALDTLGGWPLFRRSDE